jgi:hypothetical protein
MQEFELPLLPSLQYLLLYLVVETRSLCDLPWQREEEVYVRAAEVTNGIEMQKRINNQAAAMVPMKRV